MLLLLANTTDTLDITTDSGAALDIIATYLDMSTSTFAITGGGRQLATSSSATTTTILAAPAASTLRNCKGLNIRNKSTSTSVTVVVRFNANGTAGELHGAVLRPGEALEYVEGVGWFVLGAAGPLITAYATADQSIGASATALIVGSQVKFVANPNIGTSFHWQVALAKSAAATATETWSIRVGTNGTTADTAVCSFTGDTETAAADEAVVNVIATIRGPISAACVMQGIWQMDNNLSTTGFSNTARKAQVRAATSAGFDVTPTPLYVELVLATGASHAITIRNVVTEVMRG